MLNFIVLGLIPGTNISLSFTAILIILTGAAVFVLRNQMSHHKHMIHGKQAKANKISEISL